MNISKRITLALVVSFFTTLAFAQPGAGSQKLGTFLNIVEQTYVDTVNSNMLVEDAINSMLKDLDPHSVYISKKDLKKMNEPLEGKFEGVGIQFNLLRDTILVVSPISGGPSEKVGIRSGDKIVNIDGELVAGVEFKNKDVMDRLRGDKGTKVVVSIFRRDVEELLDFEIIRDKIPIYSVDAALMVTPTTGYIKVNRFAAQTIVEFKNGLDSLQKKGMQDLILDLRGNGGGYLNTAIQLADEFLSEKKLVVYTEGRTSKKQETFSTKSGNFEKGKLIVMIDEGSASASEIVSGAVQDWDRGLIVGRRSFGKGLVQKPYSLPDGSAIRLTVSRYYTPSGRCIQKPYEDGNRKDYYKTDMLSRIESGEFYSEDSIKTENLDKFETNNGRSVYGGGGIIPDVFVPIDTAENSDYYSKLIRKGGFYQYSLTLMDTKRDEWKAEYKNVADYKANFEVEPYLEGLFAYGETKKIERVEKDIVTSKRQINNLLKAYIARNLFGSGAYLSVINDLDPAFNKALEVMEDSTFKKLKLSYK